MYNKEIQINQCRLNGRIVMPPMATNKSIDGTINESLCMYYAERSMNPHVNLIITEHAFVCTSGKASKGQISAQEDSCIQGYRKIASMVHYNSKAKIFAQISHAGGNANVNANGGVLYAPSEYIYKGNQAREITHEQMDYIKNQFAEAAARIKKAGFDGVEIHGAHGYLLNQFFSPLTNHRTDEYGPQSISNRMRYITEVVKTVRQAVGNDFAISYRFGGEDYTAGGSTLEDAVAGAKLLEQAGVDLISVSGGILGTTRKNHDEPGYFSDQSEAIKKAVQIPVLLTGGVKNIEQADILLKEEKADLIGIGRALLVNPNL